MIVLLIYYIFVKQLTIFMKKKPEVDLNRIGFNPFVGQLRIEVTVMEDPNSFYTVKDESTGEIVNMPVQTTIEKRQSTKLFHSGDNKQAIYNLSAGTKSLLLYIMYNLESGKDYISLNVDHYMSTNSVKSVNTYKSAIEELIRYTFVALSGCKGVYWINPTYFFSGNRIKKYPNNLIIKGEPFTKK